MARARWRVVTGSLIACAALCRAVATAAVPLGVSLEVNGSAEPAGDLLVVRAILLPGETRLSVEVSGWIGPLDPRAPLAPLRDRKSGTARLVISGTADRPPPGQAAVVSLVIPYARMDVAPGEYSLAYEVRARAIRADGQTGETFVQPTDRTALVLSETGEFDRPLMAMAAADEPPVAERAAPLPAAAREAAEQVREAVEPLAVRAWQDAAAVLPERRRTLLYATNRRIADPAARSVRRYAAEAGDDVEYGTALVNIPIETHLRGRLETPGWWTARDPRKHFLIESLTPLDRERFLAEAGAEDVMLFVHGYNTAMEFAVLRAAQLTHDIAFPGRGMAFVWPSAGTTSGYAHDERQVDSSADALRRVLVQLADPPTRKVHVIAHSMGNRVLLRALRRIERDRAARAADVPLLGHVVLAAPDVDAASFAALVPSAARLASSTTLYFCATDRALLASRAIHVDKPVGMGPFFADGLDTIDASDVNTSMLGHGYFASEHPMLAELRLLVVESFPPAERQPPLRRAAGAFDYPLWAIAVP